MPNSILQNVVVRWRLHPTYKL